MESSHLAAGTGCWAGIRRGLGIRPNSVAAAPGCRYHNAPLTLADPGICKGANGHPLPSYGADGARSMDIADPSVRIDWFLRWFKVMAARQGRGEASDRGGGRAKV